MTPTPAALVAQLRSDARSLDLIHCSTMADHYRVKDIATRLRTAADALAGEASAEWVPLTGNEIVGVLQEHGILPNAVSVDAKMQALADAVTALVIYPAPNGPERRKAFLAARAATEGGNA